jgi:hypothetical protein
MEPISLQLMDNNCKPVHARENTVSRSVEQQMQKKKKIVRLVDIGVLEEDHSSEWPFRIHHLQFLTKTEAAQ